MSGHDRSMVLSLIEGVQSRENGGRIMQEEKDGEMNSKEDPKNIGVYQARSALVKNAEILSADKDPVLWNFKMVLMYMLHTVERMKYDVALLHKRLQPLLKQRPNHQDVPGPR